MGIFPEGSSRAILVGIMFIWGIGRTRRTGQHVLGGTRRGPDTCAAGVLGDIVHGNIEDK